MVKVMCSQMFLHWNKSKNGNPNENNSSSSSHPINSSQATLAAASASVRPVLPLRTSPRVSACGTTFAAPVCVRSACSCAHRVCLSITSSVPKRQLPDLIPQSHHNVCCHSHSFSTMSPPTASRRSSSPHQFNSSFGQMSALEIILDQEQDDSVFLPAPPCSTPARSNHSTRPTCNQCNHLNYGQNQLNRNMPPVDIGLPMNPEIVARRSASVSLPLDMEVIREVGVSLRRMSERFAAAERIKQSDKNNNNQSTMNANVSSVTQQILGYCNWVCTLIFGSRRSSIGNDNHQSIDSIDYSRSVHHQLPANMTNNSIYASASAREIELLRQRLRVNHVPARQRSYSTRS